MNFFRFFTINFYLNFHLKKSKKIHEFQELFYRINLIVPGYPISHYCVKQQHYKKAGRKDILTLLTLLSADAKSAIVLIILSLTKVKIRNFSLLHVPRWICLIHGQLIMSLRCVRMLVICKCQYFCLFDTQKSSVLS